VNQKQNRAAVAALVSAPKVISCAWLRDPIALDKVRRKVARATECAIEAKREFAFCYPASVGKTTQELIIPQAVVLDCTKARELAKGATLHKAFGVKPVKRRIIDRTEFAGRPNAFLGVRS
jgi:hypothetical protein